MKNEAKGAGVSLPLDGYPTWLAFVCAGLCAVAAGFLLTTTANYRDTYESMGVSLPYISRLVIDAPVALPLALLGAGAVLLAANRVRVRHSPVREGLGKALSAAAVAAALSACMFVYANAIAFTEMQKALQQ